MFLRFEAKMKKEKRLTILKLTRAGLVAFLFWSHLFPRQALASCWNDCQVGDVATFVCLECIFGNVLGMLTSLAGVAVLVMLVVGGWFYLTAGENPKAVERAQKTLTYAFVGLGVVIGSWFILKLIEYITGLNLSVFRVVF
jgi:hypothetical protein